MFCLKTSPAFILLQKYEPAISLTMLRTTTKWIINENPISRTLLIYVFLSDPGDLSASSFTRGWGRDEEEMPMLYFCFKVPLGWRIHYPKREFCGFLLTWRRKCLYHLVEGETNTRQAQESWETCSARILKITEEKVLIFCVITVPLWWTSMGSEMDWNTQAFKQPPQIIWLIAATQVKPN